MGIGSDGEDAAGARLFTPEAFDASEYELKHTHVDRFGPDLQWLIDEARAALELRS